MEPRKHAFRSVSLSYTNEVHGCADTRTAFQIVSGRDVLGDLSVG
jgi:hypothetical protein